VLGAGQAQALLVTVNGQQWNVTTFTGSYNSNVGKFATPQNGGVMPWWTNANLGQQPAIDFATAINNQLGFPNTAYNRPFGPFFAWTLKGSSPSTQLGSRAWDSNGFVNNPGDIFLSDTTVTWAQAYPVPGPLPVFGAVAAFSFSRKLRKRIKTGTNSVSSTYNL
jgi:hypothetical protein